MYLHKTELLVLFVISIVLSKYYGLEVDMLTHVCRVCVRECVRMSVRACMRAFLMPSHPLRRVTRTFDFLNSSIATKRGERSSNHLMFVLTN